MRLPWLWAPARRQLLRIYLLGLNLIDLGRRPVLHAVDPNKFSFSDTSGRRRSHPAGKTFALLALGQSNIANEGDKDGIHVAKPNVHNLNFLDGQMYHARDPLLGPTGYGANFLTRLGDLLAPDYASVVIVPIAHGGTSIDDWSPGVESYLSPRTGCYWRLTHAIKQIKRAGIELTAILWQQGEAETFYHNHDSQRYIHRFLSIAAVIRRMGLAAPIYVAQCTRTPEGLNEPIRQAQRDLAGYPDIKAGPDIDSVTERTADGHLNVAGLQQAAELWYQALKP